MPARRSALLPPGWTAALCTLLALAALMAGGLLAGFHPLWPVLAGLVFVLWVALAAWRPRLWLLVLPAALPVANFSPWTGWIVFEEFDLLALGAIAGGYLRHAFDSRQQAVHRQRLVWRVVPHGLGLAVGLLGMVWLWRGFADAGVEFGWFQGYADPLNSLRLFKPLAYALLLWPLLQRQLDDVPARALRQFGLGMLIGLAAVSLAVVWERAAFPGLWDFSAPYRATALFWEMHVGGAAIDAYLALAMPFAAWALWAARSPVQWTAAAALALVALYACLTTFSRGVYLAVGLPMLLLGMWWLAQRRGTPAANLLRRAIAYAALGAAATALLFGAVGVFGWVGLLAMALAAIASIALGWRRSSGWRAAAGLGLVVALILEVVAVFGTGNFMASRLGASERDFGGRLQHWSNGLALLHTPADWVWGIGLGRLPASYARFVPEREFSGAAQWVDDPSSHGTLRLYGPKTQHGLGELFALTQRVPAQPVAAYRLEFDARVRAPADLTASVCEMHLLYEGRCQIAQVRLSPAGTAWQHHQVQLRGPPLPAGKSPAPRLRVFAVTLADAGMQAELDNLRLTDNGPNVLRNAAFDRQLAHWLPVAQFYFLPWHIDNLYLELLIERGAAGLLVFLVLAGTALWSVLAGPGSRHALAPFVGAAIGAALILGMVSSLMDVPRVAFLVFLLLTMALSLGRIDGPGRSAG